MSWAKNSLVFISSIWGFRMSRGMNLYRYLIDGAQLRVSFKSLPLCSSTSICLLPFQSVESSWLGKEAVEGRKWQDKSYWSEGDQCHVNHGIILIAEWQVYWFPKKVNILIQKLRSIIDLWSMRSKYRISLKRWENGDSDSIPYLLKVSQLIQAII